MEITFYIDQDLFIMAAAIVGLLAGFLLLGILKEKGCITMLALLLLTILLVVFGIFTDISSFWGGVIFFGLLGFFGSGVVVTWSIFGK